MKIRTISAIIVLAIFIPILFIGGQIFDLFIYLISMFGLKEFLDIKSKKKEIPSFIKFISYIIMTLIILFNVSQNQNVFAIDLRIMSALFIVFLTPTVLYHERTKYSVNDAFFLIGGILFLGISMSLLIMVRSNSLNLIIYLFLITIMTDTYAYITGSLIGKNKIIESISPKKTWEGLIGGTFFGVLISSAFYYYVIDSELAIFTLILMTLFLSIIGQFGDLVFSAIKRYFDKKDFSNLMPGHGGVLDRLDSMIFVILGFMFFITLI